MRRFAGSILVALAFSVTKWLNATLDLQVIDPALNKFLDSSNHLQTMNTSVVGGLRIYSRF